MCISKSDPLGHVGELGSYGIPTNTFDGNGFSGHFQNKWATIWGQMTCFTL